MKGHTMWFKIFTGGPVVTKDFASVKKMQQYVEKHALLKRGWTGKWVTDEKSGQLAYLRRDSKGKVHASFTVVVTPMKGTITRAATPRPRINGTGRMQEANPFFAHHGKFVTVETDDAQVYIGTLHAAGRDDVVIKSGLPGRSKKLFVGDIDEVLPVTAKNPHLA